MCFLLFMPFIFLRFFFPTFVYLAVMVFFSPLYADDQTSLLLAKKLGWVKTDKKTGSLESSCLSCGGYYDETQLPQASEVGFKEAEVLIDAPPPVHYQVNGNAVFDNGVTISQPGRSLYADQATLTPDVHSGRLNQLSATGNIRIAGPGQLLLAQSLQADLIDHQAVLTNVDYLFKVGAIHPGNRSEVDSNFTGFAHGQSDSVNQMSENEYILSQATYSTCPPLTRTWELDAKTIHLNRTTDRGQAYHTILKIQGIPLLYLPYFDFPLSSERKSGFLYGSVSNSTTGGVSLGIPYYFNLAPNYDDTLTTTLFTKRGVLFDNYFRYLTKKSSGNIELQAIPSDIAYDHQIRYGYSVNNTTNFSPNWQTVLNYNTVSDDSYLQDFSMQNIFGANQVLLNRSLSTSYQSLHWNFNGVLQSYQIVNDELTTVNRPYSELPSLNLTGQYPDAYGPFSFAVSTSFTNFKKVANAGDAFPPVEAQRASFMPTLSLPLTQSYGYFTPSISLSNTAYKLENYLENGFPQATPHVSIPIFDVDTSLYLDRSFSVSGASGWSQTIQPRLFYLFVPNVDQNNIPIFDTTLIPFSYSQLFSTNTFSGLDRVGNANHLSYALSTTINNPQGQQVFSAGIGQMIYFANRQVSLCQNTPGSPPCIQTEDPSYQDRFSDIASYFTYNINADWSLTGDITYNTKYSNVDSEDYTLSYAPSTNNLFTLGYQTNRQNYSLLSTEQILSGTPAPASSVASVSFLWGFTPSWALIGSFDYSIENRGVTAEFGGLQYSACCYAVRFVMYRYVIDNNPNIPSVLTGQMDTVYMVQFLLKGLGGTSSGQIDSLLANMPGYHGQLGF